VEAGVPRALRIVLASVLILIGLVSVWVSVSLPYTLNKEYGAEVSTGPAGPAVGGLVGGVIAAACALGALHLLGVGRRIIPTGLIIVVVVVLASVAGAWLGLRAHDPALGAAAGSTALVTCQAQA
jgi:uncharacterized protein (DUF697 family)